MQTDHHICKEQQRAVRMPITYLTARRREQLRLASARHYAKHKPKGAPYDPEKYQRDKAQYKLAQAKYYQAHKAEIKARRKMRNGR